MKNEEYDVGLGVWDKILLILSLVGIIVFSYVLLNGHLIRDYFFQKKYDHAPIGQVADLQNDVRRKIGRSLVWFDASQDEVLFEGDSIFTGDESETTIDLDTGVGLEVSENSLVVLTRGDGEIFLNLQLGEVRAKVKQNQNINIVQKGKVAKIRAKNSGQIKIAKNKSGTLALTANKVKLDVEADGKRESLENQNEILKIDNDFKIEKKKFDISLTQPADRTVSWVSPGELIHFSWSGGAKGSVYLVEVSTKKDFSRLVLSQEVTQKELDFSELDLNQKYFWKVKGSQGEIAEGESRVSEFAIVSKAPPELYFPDDKLLLRQTDAENVDVQFEWENKYGVKKYRIQVANDQNFIKKIVDAEVSRPDFGPLGIAPGEYFWRVKVADQGPAVELWSLTRVFKIEAMPKPQPVVKAVEPPPKVETLDPNLEGPQLPEDWKPQPVVDNKPIEPEMSVLKTNDPPKALTTKTSKVELRFSKDVDTRSPASIKKSLSNPPKLEWSSIDGAKKYNIEIAKTEKFQEKLSVENVEKSFYEWKGARPGEFYWRVRALGEMEQVGPWSLPEKLEVSVKAPEIKGLDTKTQNVKTVAELERNETVVLKWNPVPYADQYMVTYGENLASGKSAKKFVSNPKVKLNLQPGKTEVQITVVDAKKRNISSLSNTTIVDLAKNLLLDVPKVRLPLNGMTLVSFEDDTEPVLFKWAKVKEADLYEIEFSKTKNFKKVLLNKKVKSTSFLMEDELPKGRIYWRVKAAYKNHHSGWSSVRYFNN